MHTITNENVNQKEEKISVERIAQELDLSESRMRAIFKSQIGLSPNQYVKKLKMEEAAKILRNTYKRVTVIRAKLGFNDNSHFVRDFKKAHGMTPSQYRKLHQRRSEEKAERKEAFRHNL